MTRRQEKEDREAKRRAKLGRVAVMPAFLPVIAPQARGTPPSAISAIETLSSASSVRNDPQDSGAPSILLAWSMDQQGESGSYECGAGDLCANRRACPGGSLAQHFGVQSAYPAS